MDNSHWDTGKTNQRRAMEKLHEYWQRGVAIFIETLNCMFHFSITPSRKDSHHTDTAQLVCTAIKWSSLHMIWPLIEGYFQADFRSNNQINNSNKLNNQINTKTKLNRTIIFYNEVSNKSTWGKYFESCVKVRNIT